MYLGSFQSLQQSIRARYIWPLFVLLLCFFCFFQSEAYGFSLKKGDIFFSLESDSYSEPIPLHETRHHWRQGFKHGDEAYTHKLLTQGVRWERWSVGIFARYDYTVRADPETLFLINLEENDLPLPTGRSFNLYVQGSHSKSRGVFFDYYFNDVSAGAWQFRTNLLYGYDLEIYEVSGQGAISVDDDIVADLQLEYFYGTDKLLERQNQSPSGYGFSFDLWGEWQFKSYEFSLEARDLFYQLHWHEVAHTSARADTDVVQRDSNGFISLRPLISGVEDYRSKTQTLEPRVKMNLKLPSIQKHAWILGVEHFHGFQFASAGVRWGSSESYQQFLISSRGPSLMLQMVRQGWHLAIAMDRWVDRAYSLTLDAGFRFRVF